MKVDIENVSSIKKKLVVSFPKDSVDVELKSEIARIQKEANIKGFRKGKAPLALVEKEYLPDAMKRYADRIIKESLQDIVTKKGLDIATRPVIEKEDFPEGGFMYEAVVEVHPHVDLKTYTGMTFTRKSARVTDEEIEKRVAEFRNNFVQMEARGDDEKVQNADIVNIAVLKYILDGKDMEKSDSETIDMSRETIFQEVKDALKGMKKGEDKEFSFTYPDDLEDEKLKGKKAEMHVRVLGIQKKTYPDNETLAQNLQNATFDDMKQKLHDEIAATKKRTEEDRFRTEIFSKIAEANPFEVPEGMITEMAVKMTEDFAKNLERAGVKLETMNFDWKMIFENNKKHAEGTLKRHYIIKALKEKEGVDVTEEEVDKKIGEITEKNQDKEKVLAYFQSPAARRNIYLEAIETKAMDFLIAKNSVVEE